LAHSCAALMQLLVVKSSTSWVKWAHRPDDFLKVSSSRCILQPLVVRHRHRLMLSSVSRTTPFGSHEHVTLQIFSSTKVREWPWSTFENSYILLSAIFPRTWWASVEAWRRGSYLDPARNSRQSSSFCTSMLRWLVFLGRMDEAKLWSDVSRCLGWLHVVCGKFDGNPWYHHTWLSSGPTTATIILMISTIRTTYQVGAIADTPKGAYLILDCFDRDNQCGG
jgi:hypothetical protein